MARTHGEDKGCPRLTHAKDKAGNDSLLRRTEKIQRGGTGNGNKQEYGQETHHKRSEIPENEIREHEK